MKQAFGTIFEGRTVLVTGHTGFKGSWLALWLQALGARVVGYSLPPPTTPSNFVLSEVGGQMVDIVGDVRDFAALKGAFDAYQPEVVFHLAAQPIVLHSYAQPKETFDVNAGGTVNVLEAARLCPAVKAMVMVTTDKCYENKGWLWGYRENDVLGGADPYSASKSMAELAIASYRASFFNSHEMAPVASVRAGNVIGGGDFSDFRIVPDCMKALLSNEPVVVRNPASVRPWLNVLDPLSGYLWLAARLLTGGHAFAGAWNFGPIEQEAVDVQTLVEKAIELWGSGDWVDGSAARGEAPAEMGLLRINWDKAAQLLKWRPVYDWTAALQQTVEWFKAYQALGMCEGKGMGEGMGTGEGDEPVSMQEVCLAHIAAYTERARAGGAAWAVAPCLQPEVGHII